MTAPDLVSRSGANLLATYLALGRELPGAEIREEEGYVALLSDLPHPSGNFASRLRLDPWVAGELRELATSRPAFQAVALPDDGPEHRAELLRRAGFRLVQRLATMVAPPRSAPLLPGERPPGDAYPLFPCQTPAERCRAGRFMADSFFAREPEALRATLAEAVERAEGLSVYAVSNRRQTVGAVALVREFGVMGIYNLCVAPSHRGKGHGAAVVARCLALATQEGLTATLQCVPALEPWYARHGFVRAGTMGVWSL